MGVRGFKMVCQRGSEFFCRRHYKMKFDIDPGYIFKTALTISLS